MPPTLRLYTKELILIVDLSVCAVETEQVAAKLSVLLHITLPARASAYTEGTFLQIAQEI